MELSDRYDYFFENRGRCPNCDLGLVMHMGCVGWLWKKEPRCEVSTLSRKLFVMRRDCYSELFKNMLRIIRKKLNYKSLWKTGTRRRKS